VTTHTLAGADGAAASRLLIHAMGKNRRAHRSLDAFIERLRARVIDGRRNVQTLLGLEIRDLEGHRVLALPDAGPLVDVTLPPGTYHVSTARGDTRRRYTVALEPGAFVELYLNPAGAQP
jgi:hypothetical protein